MYQRAETLHRIGPGDLFAAAADFGAAPASGRALARYRIAGPGTALSIEPTSPIRGALVYVDESASPLVLLAGELLPVPFRDVWIAPLYPCTYCPEAVDLPAGSSPAAWWSAPAELQIRTYHGPTPLRAPAARQTSIVSGPVTFAAEDTDAGGVAASLYLPTSCASKVRIFGSNENHTNSDTLVGTVYRSKPYTAPGGRPPKEGDSGTLRGPSLGTFTIPAAADGGACVELVIDAPGCPELLVVLRFGASTTAGAARFSLGADLNFLEGA